MVESRVADTKDAIRRRRECQACGRRFTTYERCEEMPLVVVKTSGERQGFDRAKLLDGLQRACHKRQVSTASLDLAVRDIEAVETCRLWHARWSPSSSLARSKPWRSPELFTTTSGISSHRS